MTKNHNSPVENKAETSFIEVMNEVGKILAKANKEGEQFGGRCFVYDDSQFLAKISVDRPYITAVKPGWYVEMDYGDRDDQLVLYRIDDLEVFLGLYKAAREKYKTHDVDLYQTVRRILNEHYQICLW